MSMAKYTNNYETIADSSLRSDEGVTLKMTASQFFYGGNLTFINSFDTRFSCFFSAGTSLQSFFNLTLSLFVTETEVCGR